MPVSLAHLRQTQLVQVQAAATEGTSQDTAAQVMRLELEVKASVAQGATREAKAQVAPNDLFLEEHGLETMKNVQRVCPSIAQMPTAPHITTNRAIVGAKSE